MNVNGIKEILLYPPSFDQISLIANIWQLWLLRIFSLCLLFLVLENTAKLALKTSRSIWIFRFLIYLSSAFFVLGFSYPWDCLKIILVCLLFLGVMKTKKYLWGYILIGIMILIGINLYLLKLNVPVINDLSISDAQKEVTLRFYRERQMNTEAVPTVIRRTAYNKYSLAFKKGVEDIFRVGDLESLFFQEVHPLSQKSIVLFYYPAFALFVLSLWLLVQKKVSIEKEVLVFWGVMAMVYFSVSDMDAYRKLLPAFVFLSIIIAVGTDKLLVMKGILGKITIIALFLNMYGVLANSVDWTKRPDFWFDNRPLFYKKIFQMKTLNNFPQVVLADIFGHGEKYCYFYRNDCLKFEFAQSDLRDRLSEKNNLMVGFRGSFANIKGTNIDFRHVIESVELRDNIANGYSTNIVAIERNPLPKL